MIPLTFSRYGTSWNHFHVYLYFGFYSTDISYELEVYILLLLRTSTMMSWVRKVLPRIFLQQPISYSYSKPNFLSLVVNFSHFSRNNIKTYRYSDLSDEIQWYLKLESWYEWIKYDWHCPKHTQTTLTNELVVLYYVPSLSCVFCFLWAQQ